MFPFSKFLQDVSYSWAELEEQACRISRWVKRFKGAGAVSVLWLSCSCCCSVPCTCSSYRNVCSDNPPVILQGGGSQVMAHSIPKQYLLEEADPTLFWLL